MDTPILIKLSKDVDINICCIKRIVKNLYDKGYTLYFIGNETDYIPITPNMYKKIKKYIKNNDK